MLRKISKVIERLVVELTVIEAWFGEDDVGRHSGLSRSVDSRDLLSLFQGSQLNDAIGCGWMLETSQAEAEQEMDWARTKARSDPSIPPALYTIRVM